MKPHDMTDFELMEKAADHYKAALEIAKQEIERLRAELQLRNDELRSIRHTIVATVGGVDYEGFPTSEINWLQRLRILLEKEKQLKKLISK